jgi:cytidylate kinase
VAERLGFAHLDSGALYRAITLAALDQQAPLAGQALVALAGSLPVRLSLVDDAFRPEVAGVDVSAPIRSDAVNAKVSTVAAIGEVRDWVNRELRAAAQLHPRGVVVDGRDIGTVVFPDAALKVFLTASALERARRRLKQDAGEGALTDAKAVKRVVAEIAARDEADSSRAIAPLVAARDAKRVDTSAQSFEEGVERIVALASNLFA